MSTPDSTSPTLVRIDAAGAVDAVGTAVAPASLLIEIRQHPDAGDTHPVFPARLLAVGRPSDIDRHEAARSPGLVTIRRPDSVVVPGLVNAHTHLDLTHIGPQPHDPVGGFVPWINMIRLRRESEPERISSSVRRGVELSLAAGVVAVGDIAGAVRGRMSLQATRTLRDSRLVGVSWLEFFGIGRGETPVAAMLDALPEMVGALMEGPSGVRVGLQPHAPNTVSRALYRKAIELSERLGLPDPSTHLAETPEEREFIGHARGPQRELLESLGIWDDSILADLGRGEHAVAHLTPVLEQTAFTVAHVNDADDAAIDTLARTDTRVAYCPRASAYFGAERHFGPHRYRDMLKAGIPVALGTDSVVNLPVEAGRSPSEDGRGMSILDEMRFLYKRDSAAPLELLRMATVHGAKAVSLPPPAFTLSEGSPLAGLVAVPISPVGSDTTDPAGLAERIVQVDSIPELLFANTFSDLTGKPGP